VAIVDLARIALLHCDNMNNTSISGENEDDGGGLFL